MPLTIDDVPDSFYGSYVRKHKIATEADIIKAYEKQQARHVGRSLGKKQPEIGLNAFAMKMDVVEYAFEHQDKHDQNNTVNAFLKFLQEECINRWTPDCNYYSPYMSVVQASGMGKNVQQELDLGYPKRSSITPVLLLDHKLTKMSNNGVEISVHPENIHLLFLGACIDLLATSLKMPLEWFYFQKSCSFWSQIHALMENLKNEIPEPQSEISPTNLSKFAEPNHWMLYGRPLWGALVQAQHTKELKNKYPLLDILLMAAGKLIGGVDFRNWFSNYKIKNERVTPLVAIAVLGQRLVLNIIPQSELAMELVASAMRVCLHITEDRGTILSTYLSEPTLAEAAAYIMNIDNGLLVPDLLTMLINSIKEGVAEASYRGELVAHFLLLLAYDYACSQFKATVSYFPGYYSQGITVQQFLQALLDYEIFNLIATDISTSKPNALAPLEQGAAVLCKHNQCGVDIIIPVLLDPEGRMNINNITYILVQVKNWRHTPSQRQVQEASRMKLSPEFAGITTQHLLPYLSLYLQLGDEKCTAHVVEDIGILPEVDSLYKLVLSNPNLLKCPADNVEIPLKRVKIGRNNPHYPSETSVSSVIRQTFQVSLAVYGLGEEVSVAWPDAAELEDDSERVRRMQPLVYIHASQ
ncbi:5278_t:CDS:2 [Paraglomus brasilianum]|uniref:5278_t:CDS:1 n=1 Tax=Paraglomus brasilianum TaxID=144538 RepID=A0A9N8Z8F5_9GLOM|nr:5278_t:CDS:2 [Paraglomus brasilianum]